MFISYQQLEIHGTKHTRRQFIIILDIYLDTKKSPATIMITGDLCDVIIC